GEVDQIFLAGILEALLRLEVIITVRQTETGGVDVGDDLRGIVKVWAGSEPERNKDGELMETADHALKVGRSFHGINVAEHRLGRLAAEFVNPRLIHTGAIVVADELLYAAARPVRAPGDVIEDVLELLLGLLAGLPAPAPSHERRRNRVFSPPLAV